MTNLSSKLQRYQKFFSFMLKYWNSELLRYTSSQAMEETQSEESYDFNHSPEELAEDLKQMGPTYIKLGQLLSTRPDLLPEAYLNELACLQDDAPTIPYEKIHEIVEAELGTRISKAFEEFEEKPLASASIGQVHLAKLRSGKKVVVKIQRPNIQEDFLKDLDTLTEIAAFAVKHSKTAQQYAFNDVLEELRYILLQELDYQKEAANLSKLHKNLQHFKNIIVPKPISDYSTQKVLTMEYIEGVKVTSISPFKKIEENYTPLVEELVKAYLQQILEDGFVHADPHPGNIHLTKDCELVLLDAGMTARFSSTLRENILQLLMAVSKTDGDKTAELLQQISEIDKDADIEHFKHILNRLLFESENSKAKDLKTGRLLIQINQVAAQNGIHIPVEINILGKVLMNMDQIIAELDPEFELQPAIRHHLKKLMQKKMWEELKPENFFHVLIDLKKLIEQAPRRLNKVSGLLANNDLKLNLEVLDEEQLTQGLQKVANRITLGLILASLIIGAAMLMQVPTSFTIFGYPGLAIILFLLAALGGVILMFNIIFKDR